MLTQDKQAKRIMEYIRSHRGEDLNCGLLGCEACSFIKITFAFIWLTGWWNLNLIIQDTINNVSCQSLTSDKNNATS
jgi:hypothetical protein